MLIHTPAGLYYPITVTRVRHKPGDEVQQNAPLFDYSYVSRRPVTDKDKGEEVMIDELCYSSFESELEGTLVSLDVEVDQVMHSRQQVAEIEEACAHEVQFGGLCANCGKDMNAVESYNSTRTASDRARINTLHDMSHGDRNTLLLSHEGAAKADLEVKQRLLDVRKLTLIVDLDQTVIQACVEATVGEWQNDPQNPNYEALKEVRNFRLKDDAKVYYLKLRPGLFKFLEEMSELYEMHVYTMATREYALNVQKIIDPEQKLFNNRVLSREDNHGATVKNLKRLFPVDTSMVVMIDDRGDVWRWSANLIKVVPYDFFVGIGDINSNFLPARQELAAAPKKPVVIAQPEAPVAESASPESPESDKSADASSAASEPSTAPTTPEATNGTPSAVDLMASMADEAEGSMEKKEKEHDQALDAQIEDQPLRKKQMILDAAEQEAKDSPAVEAAAELLAENGEKKEGTPEHAKYRHNLLEDDDTELKYLGEHLRNVHKRFFDAYDAGLNAGEAGRVAELKPGKSRKRSLADLANVPDTANVIQDIRSQVLRGVNLVFSGVVPLGVDIHSHDTVIWAKTFGATISENITKRTTHVIASPERRTAKVRQAAKKGGRIAIVSTNWLFACFSQWSKVDEGPYRIHSDAPINGIAGLPAEVEGKEEGTLSGSEEEAALTEPETETEKDGLVLDMELAELEKHKPSISREDSSPTETEHAEDWEGIDDELAEFLGSDAEGSESESESSVRSSNSTPDSTPGGRKRKRAGAEDVDGESEKEEEEGSRLQKRKKEALGRTSSLTNMASAESPDRKENMPVVVEPGGDGEEDEDEDDLDLEAALAAELEKEDGDE